jgi:hypothetical protein
MRDVMKRHPGIYQLPVRLSIILGYSEMTLEQTTGDDSPLHGQLVSPAAFALIQQHVRPFDQAVNGILIGNQCGTQ